MKLPKRVYVWSLIIALGGFLFGFDTAVISGAEQAIQHYWFLSSIQIGFTVSIAIIGTVIGALTGGIPSDNLGRKKTLFFIAILYLLSSIGTAVSTNWELFLVLRFIGGIAVGVSCVVAPIYISEISPANSRGMLVALFQFNVVVGILLAYISNYFISIWLPGNIAWRIMLGILAIPSLILLICIRFVPESPRWLILKKNNVDGAAAIFTQINPEETNNVVRNIIDHKERTASEKTSLWQKKYMVPIVFAGLIAFFNQVAGINAIIYYAPRIIEMTGLGKGASLLSTVGIGLVNFIFTLVAINIIDKAGRKKLMLVGSIGLIVTLGLISRSFYLRDFGNLMVVVLLLIYIAFFAFSQGAVVWVFIAEIFPNQVRAKGQSMGSFINWATAALIAFIFPYLAGRGDTGGTFLFFTIMMVLQLIFVIRFMPETKGRSLEQIDDSFKLKISKSSSDEKILQR
ncbi:MAG: sugar porter family MFS transporter [Chitinophagaceae bacterium]